MPVMDEFQEERATLKGASFKKKAQYFYDYYKWYVIVAVIAIIVIVDLVHHYSTRKETIFHACLLNAGEQVITNDVAEHSKGFAEYIGMDFEKEEIQFDNSMSISGTSNNDYESAQKLMVFIAAQELDVMACDVYTMLRYAYQNDFFDLRTVLSEQQIADYQDYFYYIDRAVARSMDENSYSLVSDTLQEYPNPYRPEEMEDPIPVGVKLPENCSLNEHYIFGGEAGLSILVNTTHLDTSIKFIDYQMQVIYENQ